jgi:predicted RNA binding protein with dsRBD fold (UPF0201 family)
MSNFFDSDIIQEELNEIQDLQNELLDSPLYDLLTSREQQLKHIDTLSRLLEKQRIMYTRLSLSDDPQAIQMKENLRKSISLLGYPSDVDMNTVFSSMTQTIDYLKGCLDT